jgi:hypothetical protein
VQGRCRVEQREQHKVFHVEGLRLDLRNSDFPFQQRLRRPVSQCADQLRTNQLNLLQEKRLAGLYFVQFRITVFRWPALDDIRDINIIT